MVHLIVDTDYPEECPHAFAGPTDDLVYFLSFAVSAGYGASHELSQAAERLRRQHGINLRPLLTFYDRVAEDEEDRQHLEEAWQEAAPLARSCRRVAEALKSDRDLQELTQGFPALLPRLEELATMAEWAAEREARVRITFSLE